MIAMILTDLQAPGCLDGDADPAIGGRWPESNRFPLQLVNHVQQEAGGQNPAKLPLQLNHQVLVREGGWAHAAAKMPAANAMANEDTLQAANHRAAAEMAL